MCLGQVNTSIEVMSGCGFEADRFERQLGDRPEPDDRQVLSFAGVRMKEPDVVNVVSNTDRMWESMRVERPRVRVLLTHRDVQDQEPCNTRSSHAVLGSDPGQ